jgi:hypothetical protein
MQPRPAERQPAHAVRRGAVRAAPVVVAAPPTAGQALQRRLGNAGLSAMLAGQEQRVGRVAANPSASPVVARSPAQALVVSSPSDPAEREAEKVGRRVMAMSPGPPAAPRVSNPEAAKIARVAAPAPGPAPGVIDPEIGRELEAAQSGGSPLPEAIRNHMERSFHADFSRVRIHTDERAARLSVRLGAQAFTRGNHIYFARGAFSPDTRSGGELIAHELTHTIQQAPAVQRRVEMPSSPEGEHSSPTIQRAPASAAASAATSSEVVDISSGVFCPSQRVKDEIEVQRGKGLDVRVVVKGLTAEGRVKVRTDSRKNYVSLGKGSMPLLNPWTEQLGGMHVNFAVIKNEIVHGYASLKPRGADPNDWLQALKNSSSALGGLGLKVGRLPKAINKFEHGKLTLGVSDLNVEVGGFVDAHFNLSVEDISQPKIDATANIDIKGLEKGQLKLNNDAGKLVGQLSLAITYKAFSGEAHLIYKADGSVDVVGKAAYNADKLSGEVQFVATDLEAANSFTKNAIAAAGGKENVQQAAAPAPVPAPKEGQKKRALAATGQLAFNLTKWFAGTVNVIVDGKGAVTVIGKIAPPAEICLFTQKDWDYEIIKFEAKAYYGIPVVGDLNLFANISLHALAKLGPAKIYNIEILGTYSTDPEVQKNIQISGSINISAYGGLRLRAEGGAGVEILEHDLKFGIGLNADVGVKAYADARPTIGYRDPGVFYISGTLELVAQPVLGLGGDFFIALETPWWSPLSDDRWTWPLFSKEWLLTDPIGISAAVKDYELGSGKVPEIELKKPEFDPSKFMTSMVDKTLPDKSGGAGAAHGTFKEDGTVPKPVVPPKKPAPKAAAPKPPKKGAPLKGGKSASPDPKAAKEQQSGKILANAAKPLAALKAKEALTRSELDKELAKIKGQVSGIEFGVQVKSGKWLVIPKAGGRTAKGIEIAAKQIGKEDKKGDRTDEQKQADLESAIAGADALLSAPNADVEAVRKQLPAIKSKYKLSTLDIVIDSEETDDEIVHIHAEINPKKDGPKKKKQKGKIGNLGITRKRLSFTAETKRYLIKKFKSEFPPGMLGEFKDASLDIRHKVSISDTIKHVNEALSPLTVEQAAAKLAENGHAPTRKGRPGIIEAARELLQEANNDVTNLFVGAAGKNRRKRQRYDPGDVPGTSATAKRFDPQKAGFIGEYGFEGTDFKVTIDITEDGVHVETWEVVL